MITRQVIAIDTDTGSQTDTGPAFFGEVCQVHWAPTTGDTGGDLAIYLLVDATDTGRSITILDDNDSLGANRTWAPRQPIHGTDGNREPADTGAQYGEPFVSAGESLRVRVTPGGAAVAGSLYVWTRNIH